MSEGSACWAYEEGPAEEGDSRVQPLVPVARKGHTPRGHWWFAGNTDAEAIHLDICERCGVVFAVYRSDEAGRAT
jgi:hypothetical protein